MTGRARPADLDRAIARLLTIGTYASVAALTAGVLAMIATGRAPTAPPDFPPLDLGRMAGDLGAARPEGFLWLGLLVVIGTPSARVAASLIGYLRNGERQMAVVAVLILAVIVASVAISLATGGSAG